jgi:DNA-3-methyladenine glycosylase
MKLSRLDYDFYRQDVLKVAPGLIGKYLVRKFEDGQIIRRMITEVEAYRGEEDMGCHANKGRTARTEIMYHGGGVIYVYLIYGMYWMLNFVTGQENNPQAVLIRGLDEAWGPGKIGRLLKIDGSFYGTSLVDSGKIWIEDNGSMAEHIAQTRIGIDYAGEIWKNKLWRFILK